MKRIFVLLILVLALAISGIIPAAQEKAQTAAKPAATAKDTPAPAMSPEEKAAMDKMIEAGTPGEPHKFLVQFVGMWQAVVKVWHAAGQQPDISEGISLHRMVMGGRYLQQTFKSTFMDAPFEGMGFMGYNNVLKKYEGVWMDNMSTAIMTSEGSLSADGKSLKSVSTYSDCQTGKEKTSRDVLKMVSPDKFVSEMYDIGPDGKEFLMMEITYTRDTRPTRGPQRPPVTK